MILAAAPIATTPIASLPVAGIPFVPSTESIYYIFDFASQNAARLDSVVGALTTQEVLLYLQALSSIPFRNGRFQPMVVRNGPVSQSLLAHPNIFFAIDLRLPSRGISAVIKTQGVTKAQMATMMIMLSNFGTIVVNGVV